MAKCGKCAKDVVDVNCSITCVECKEVYHATTCTSIRSKTTLKSMGARKDTWKCENCGTDSGSLSGRSDTGVSESSVLAAIANMNEEINKKIDARFDLLQDNIKSVKEEINSFKNDIKKLQTAQDSTSNEVVNLKGENDKLKKEVAQLTGAVHDLQQYSRINNIIVAGIPKTPGEDVLAILDDVANVLKVQFHHLDVSAAHRLPSRRGGSDPPLIVVQFVSRATKNTWIEAKKAKKKFTTADLSVRLAKHDIFINEHLTPPVMALFSKARELRKAGRLLHTWVRDGKVFVRKQERGPALRVNSLQDLEFPPLDKQ